MIELEHLTRRYSHDQRPALDNLSLTIPDGAIFGILGRSGAGKSTLIRCINLLERPDAGRVLVDGEDINRLSQTALRQQRRRCGMIFQHFNLLHGRSVAGNVAVGLEIAGVKDPQRRARVSELLDLVGLSDKASAYPAQLSGGQQQRVGIARALAAQPSYLLCDEATSALDAETTASVLALLQQINQQFGLTIVMISHQLEVVRAICTHAALLEQGAIVESGALSALLRQPDSLLRSALLHDPREEQRFLQRHGIHGGELCAVA